MHPVLFVEMHLSQAEIDCDSPCSRHLFGSWFLISEFIGLCASLATSIQSRKVLTAIERGIT
jgi:hypothetical protein